MSLSLALFLAVGIVSSATLTTDSADTADTAELVSPQVLHEEDLDDINQAERPSPTEWIERETRLRAMPEYRSPRKAFIRSFLLPGFGQAYTKHYSRCAVYAGAEIFLAAMGAAFYYRCNEALKTARDTADAHFSSEKFWNYYEKVDAFLDNYAFSDSQKTMVKQDVLWDSAGFARSAVERSDSYYRSIGNGAFVHGWDDAEPVFTQYGVDYYDVSYSYDYKRHYPEYSSYYLDADDVGLLVWQVDKTTHDTLAGPVWGYSTAMERYDSLVHEANVQYRIAGRFVILIAVNHFVSACDALISAIAWNMKLEKKSVFLDRIHLEHDFAVMPNGIRTGVRLRIGI